MDKIHELDSLEGLKQLDSCSVDINYSDPPYALGSEIVIRDDGKVDYKTARDFMNRWDMPTAEFWEEWFKEAFRTLKHGGYVIMFGMDRQLLLFKYYAHLAGFEERQSLYWYNIEGFPKAADLSKNIDKSKGVEREVVGYSEQKRGSGRTVDYGKGREGRDAITAPASRLGQKYQGYKYSRAPLKQTNETIMVFQKPYKTGSCLHDTFAYESGDDDCTVGALNIDGSRIETTDKTQRENNDKGFWSEKLTQTKIQTGSCFGRYPSQTFVDSEAAKKLDEQSGDKCGQQGAVTGREPSFDKDTRLYGDYSGQGKKSEPRNDPGGCSKILHKCDYEKGELDLYIYQPKVTTKERDAGLDDEEDLEFTSDVPVPQRKERPFYSVKNNHPTVKPIELNRKILTLFKTPNPQTIVYPFAGVGSEVIGGIKAGFENYIGFELSEKFIDIAEKRIKYWRQ